MVSISQHVTVTFAECRRVDRVRRSLLLRHRGGQENDSWNARVRRGRLIVGAPPPFAEGTRRTPTLQRSGWIYWNAFMVRRPGRIVPRTAGSLDGLTERSTG